VIVFFTTTAISQQVNLYTWYSADRKDHFTTSEASWQGNVGEQRSGYTLIRIEGTIFSPTGPRPSGTLPLYNFWSADRTDNFLTSDPAWTSRGESGGYHRSRLVGYILESPKAGTIPLVSYWSATNKDNYATTDPRLELEPSSSAGNKTTTVAGRGYRSFRIEGYLTPPTPLQNRRSESSIANLEAIGFGTWRPLQPSERERRPSDPLERAEPRFTTPLLIVPLEFGTARFSPDDIGRFARLASSDSDISLERALKGLSRGRFAWKCQLTAVVRDRITDEQHWALGAARNAVNTGQRQAYERQQGYNLDVYDLDHNGVGADELDMWGRVLKIIDPFVRYNRYDVNGDGVVDSSELVVLRFGADPGVGATTLKDEDTDQLPSIILDGVRVKSSVSVLAKDTTYAGIVHEMLHVWGGIDIYGPFYGAHNQRASLMAAMARDDRFWELDPWHRQMFGWTEPIFIPIGPSSRRAGGTRVMMASGADSTGVEEARPLLFYDPARGLREYFLVEYRTPFPTCADSTLPGNACPGYRDNGAADIGFAVWHVMTMPNGKLTTVTRASDTANRFLWAPSTTPASATRGLGVIDPSDGRIGAPRFLKPANGELALRWIDGTDTGLRLQAGAVSTSANSAIVQWRDAASPLTPRLDRIAVEGSTGTRVPRVNAGQVVPVDGLFHAQRSSLTASLVSDAGARTPLTITAWNPDRILVEIPTNIAAGGYEIVVADSRNGGGSAAAVSDGLGLEVSPERVAARTNLANTDFMRLMQSSRTRSTPHLTLDLNATAASVPNLPPPDPSSAVPVDTYPGH